MAHSSLEDNDWDWSELAKHQSVNVNKKLIPDSEQKHEIEKKHTPVPVDSRISYTLAPGDTLIQCPYEIAHLIL